jgi:5-methylcytosine-specific restriction enzyme A
MTAITLAQIKSAFAMAAAVHQGQIESGVAAKRLNEETGLNASSARDFFAQYRRMLAGEVFKRSLSAEALAYFLSAIQESKGREAAESALTATWKHIAYYESLDGTHLNRLRAVATAFQQSLPGPTTAPVVAAAFEAAVVRSQLDSQAQRAERLKSASPVPTTRVVLTTVYDRNPDVVAEVLARSKGICEQCEAHAPFLRRKDGSPYLEVHHRKQLAKGGEDTVANALALCPNCHRQSHHG